MSLDSKIEWTEASWNPTTGCTKISAGCKNCYAERLALRLKAMGNANYWNGFKLTLQEHMLDVPLKWKKPQMIFVNSMSDLFHEDIPLEFIQKVFDVMGKARHHQFQILTKRSQRLARLNSRLEWHPNIWMGVTVESDAYLERIYNLVKTDAKIKFLSLEPLLTRMPEMDLNGIDWVIAGGESGPHSRIMKKEWVISIKNQCQEQNIPFFFKQWGGTNKKKTGRLLEGRVWNQLPLFSDNPEQTLAPA
ncbi:MAG: phage Gp37/Gp68 family protein [Desulfobacteraceae bacterium]|nr:phage Gp37/Gp68 family protein [Desulfobacteraceae bacterium]